MNPMVDGWRGDDWFHNGAFRQQNLPYIYEQTATRANDELWQSGSFDDYDLYMRAGSAGELGRQHGMEQIGFWNKIVAHPGLRLFLARAGHGPDPGARAADRADDAGRRALGPGGHLRGHRRVQGAITPIRDNRDKLFLVLGPWYHGQQIEEASALGPIRFGSDTGLYFRRQILAPFLAHYLKDDASTARRSRR